MVPVGFAFYNISIKNKADELYTSGELDRDLDRLTEQHGFGQLRT